MGGQLPGSPCLVWSGRLEEAPHSCSIEKRQDIITRAPRHAETLKHTHGRTKTPKKKSRLELDFGEKLKLTSILLLFVYIYT